MTPASWYQVGRHALLPEAGHDDVARFDVIAQLNTLLADRLAPAVRATYEQVAAPAWEAKHGRAPANRKEVAEALAHQPAYRAWSLVRRNTMEYRQHTGRALALRQMRKLRDRAREFNDGADTLHLDPQLDIPKYVASVDTHLMPGGYACEVVDGDVCNAANYDSGLFATLGGAGGPWNDAAGRALVAWLARHAPDFSPRTIVDLGCGLGHNTLPLRCAFPSARVVAIDVAAPFLRYGHARARSLGIDDLEFRQEDATHTSLPSGSCDLVFTTMVLHETSHDALRKILSEAKRLLAPGGLTIHLEQPPYRQFDAYEQFMRDWDGRYNNEPFWSALHETDVPSLLRSTGFEAANVFETRCSAPLVRERTQAEGAVVEDFGRAPSWYAIGAWQTAHGNVVKGEYGHGHTPADRS